MTSKPENHIANYYLLKRLVLALDARLKGLWLVRSYSFNKNEIVFEFSDDDVLLTLKGYFTEQSFVFLPDKPSLPSVHSKNCFPEIGGRKVETCKVHFQDRSFRIHLEGGCTLVFIMYGRNGNVLLFKGDEVIDLLRNQFEKHRHLLLSGFEKDRAISLEEYTNLSASSDAFMAVNTLFKGFSNGMALYRETYSLASKETRAQWLEILNLERLFISGPIDIINLDHAIVLSLLPGMYPDGVIYSGTDVFEALDKYARNYFYQKNFRGLKEQKLNAVKAKIEKTRNQILSSNEHLYHIEHDNNYKNLADIIMANLHQIPNGAENVKLFDFYSDTYIEISLKRGASPQSWAEKLYRKSKNQEIEKHKTIQRIQMAEDELSVLEKELKEIDLITDLKEMKIKAKAIEKETIPDAQPYRHFEVDGYSIYVGKSAANNDELSFDFAHKEDLWLHARNVSGSHVIIRHQQNGLFPKNVIEAAARIAAWYSKSRGSILTPVIYTLCKFVRKPRGAAPGAVICEKEKAILVKPGIGHP